MIFIALSLVGLLGFMTFQVLALRKALTSRSWNFIAAGYIVALITNLMSLVAGVARLDWTTLLTVNLSTLQWFWLFLRYLMCVLLIYGFHLLRRDLKAIHRWK